MAASIRPAGLADLPEVRRLFEEYERFLGFSLCFQGFTAELAALPGVYAPPGGELLLAEVAGKAAGCVALRPDAAAGVCEMKRLYLRPDYQGRGLGRQLAEAILATAAERGYSAMRLHTLRRLAAALALYQKLGFREVKPFEAIPQPEVIHLEKALKA